MEQTDLDIDTDYPGSRVRPINAAGGCTCGSNAPIARVARRRLLGNLLRGAAASLLLALPVFTAAETAPKAMAADDALPSVITAGSDHAIKHWDTTGRLLGTIGTHNDAVTALASARGELVCACADGKLKGISLATGKSDFNVKAHLEGPIALALSSDGSLLATGGADSVLRLWDGRNGHFLTDFPKAHGGAITALQMTSDHTHLVSGSADRMLRIWRIGGDAKRPTIAYQANIVAHDDTVNAIALSPDDKLIASVSSDGVLKIWNLDGGSLVQRVRLGAGGLAVAFSPDGRTVATGAADGKIRLWNPENGMTLPFMAGHERSVTALAWTADGKVLVSGGEDKTLRFWNLSTGHQIARITAHDGAVRAIVLP